jgi:serine/threonine-protein phosphatase 6 regulatory ankyrin repeat subunit A
MQKKYCKAQLSIIVCIASLVRPFVDAMEKPEQKNIVAYLEYLPVELQFKIVHHVGENKNLNDIRNYCIVFDKRWGTNYHSDIDALICFLPPSVRNTVDDKITQVLALKSKSKWNWLENPLNSNGAIKIQLALQAIIQKAPITFLQKLINSETIDPDLCDDNRTCLLSHAIMHHNQKAIQLLLTQQALTDTYDYFNRTPFIYAALAGNVPAAQQLILREKHEDKERALLIALQQKNNPLVDLIYPENVDLTRIRAWELGNIAKCIANHQDPKFQRTFLKDPAIAGNTTVHATLIEDVIKKRNIPFLTILLAHNIKPTGKALLTAAIKGFADIAQLLVKRGVDPDEIIDEYSGCKALHQCCRGDSRKDYSEAVKILIDLGADINAVDRDGDTPLITAVREKKLQSATTLLANKAIIVDKANNEGKTPLRIACERENHPLVTLLLEHGACINTVSQNNYSPLTIACLNDNKELVLLLLKKNADYTIGTGTEKAPLCLTNNLGVIKYLIEAGADLSTHKHIMLHKAISSVNKEIVQYLLENNMDTNGEYNGKTPLQHICESWRHETSLEIAELLVKHGAIVAEKNSQGKTALHYAAENFNGSLVQFLLDHGANVNDQDPTGKTPLMIAARFLNSEEIIDILSNAGADPLLTDHDGNTALSIAQEQAATCHSHQERYPWFSFTEKLVAVTGKGYIREGSDKPPHPPLSL